MLDPDTKVCLTIDIIRNVCLFVLSINIIFTLFEAIRYNNCVTCCFVTVVKVSRKQKLHAVEVDRTGRVTVEEKEEEKSLSCVGFLVTISGLMVDTALKGPTGSCPSYCGGEALAAQHLAT